MLIDKNIVNSLLIKLKDQISRIENMDFSEEELTNNIDIQDLLSHRIHIAVEVATDIAMHIASVLELPGRESASNVIKLLGTHKIINKNFAEKFQDAPKLRNLLIHGYDNIDYRLLYKDYKNDLSELKEFARQIKNYLEKN